MSQTDGVGTWTIKQVIALVGVLVTVFLFALSVNVGFSERVTRTETKVDALEKQLDQISEDIEIIRQAVAPR